jgi:polyhydroxyalkanoate synthesis repressor PhaR
MVKAEAGANEPVIIKKYANRRLYNTSSSSYITLDDLAKMTREGVEFQVLDAKTGADITHLILTQIIMDEEANGAEQMLPISFLRQLIGMYGNSMQALLPQYLEASMENFQANQRKLQDVLKQSMGGETLAKMAETNMAMFKAAASAFIPNPQGGPQGAEEPGTGEAAKPQGNELAALREQMAEIQKKLDSLGK